MYKYTEKGIEQVGEEQELSSEDQIFIRELFEDFANYENPDDFFINPNGG